MTTPSIVCLTFLVCSIRCYQCSSQTDPKGVDNCGAYIRFNKTQNIAIECNSDESNMPGSFCMKVVQQGPRGFICEWCIQIYYNDLMLSHSFTNRGWSMETSNPTLCFSCRHRCDRCM